MATQKWKDDLENALTEVLPQYKVKELKSEQKLILQNILEHNDCMVTLPTGYGKSLPYQILLPVARKMKELGSDTRTDGKIVVCGPLVSLFEDQVSKLQSVPMIKSAFKGASKEVDEMIAKGDVDIVFASPEALVGDKDWRSIIQEFAVSLIVIDEFHTVATWGGLEEPNEEKAFRKWFKYIGELRSLFPDASLLALSATCTKKIRKLVMEALCLQTENLYVVTRSPNKTNIKIVVNKVESQIESSMCWLIDTIKVKKMDIEPMLLYANSIKDVSNLYKFITTEIQDFKPYVQMYHSETTDQIKSLVLSDLQKCNHDLKIVIATSALGMGVDIVNINTVLFYGPPRSIVDLVQEVGRVGRDGSVSVAFILYNHNHMKFLDVEVKDLVKLNDGCRRQNLLRNFISEKEVSEVAKKESDKHSCCDLCEKVCKCGNCMKLNVELYFGPSGAFASDLQLSSDSETISYDKSLYLHMYESDTDIEDLTDHD
ncbi:ATP-dependent DNA helicase RecQ-like [Mytilus galloprovincialis]|uniref:ATP-dependent DNA helicase RecQ-like n=1 Tax=Mytilus galloprovincialis TaxID=29158 RepID=UPI003F7C1ED6